MSFYETLYIIDPNLENKSLEKTMNEIGKELEKTTAIKIGTEKKSNVTRSYM